MRSKTKKEAPKRTREALLQLPLSGVRYLSRSPRTNKIVVEISTDDITRVNAPETLDEIINQARLDYATGNYTTHKTARSLIAALDA